MPARFCSSARGALLGQHPLGLFAQLAELPHDLGAIIAQLLADPLAQTVEAFVDLLAQPVAVITKLARQFALASVQHLKRGALFAELLRERLKAAILAGRVPAATPQGDQQHHHHDQYGYDRKQQNVCQRHGAGSARGIGVPAQNGCCAFYQGVAPCGGAGRAGYDRQSASGARKGRGSNTRPDPRYSETSPKLLMTAGPATMKRRRRYAPRSRRKKVRTLINRNSSPDPAV